MSEEAVQNTIEENEKIEEFSEIKKNEIDIEIINKKLEYLNN